MNMYIILDTQLLYYLLCHVILHLHYPNAVFQISLPTADLDCDLKQYVDILCGRSNRSLVNVNPLSLVYVCVRYTGYSRVQ